MTKTGVHHVLREPCRVDADPQLVVAPHSFRDRLDAAIDEAREVALRAGVAAPGAEREHVAALATDPDEGRHLHLALVREGGALLSLAAGVDVGGVRVDREAPRRWCSSHRPGASQHLPVHRLGLGDPSDVGTGQETKERRVRGEGVIAAQAPRRLVTEAETSERKSPPQACSSTIGR